jgi:hypothetical protein
MSISCVRSLVALTAATVFSGVGLAQAQPLQGGSHRPLEGGTDIPASPEAMSRRLREMTDSREALRLAKDLLDPSILEKLQAEMPRKTLEELREKLGRGESPAGDPAFQKFLNGLRENPSIPDLQKDKIDLLRRQFAPPPLSRPPPDGGPSGGPRGGMQGTPPGAVPQPGPMPDRPQPPPDQPLEAPKSSWTHWREEAYRWAREHSGDISDRVIDAMRNFGGDDVADIIRDGLRSFGKGMEGDDGLAGKIAEAIREAGGSLAGLADKLPYSAGAWDSLPDAIRENIPSLPRPRHLSLPTIAANSVQETGPVVLWIAVVVVVGCLLWRSTSGQRGGGAASWRLGPWPVPPGAVATRRDLVLSFEHLALLCLGLQARSCHHLELADRLAALKADPKQRQAAADLAHLYEQARYAPDEGPLSDEDVRLARRDLCLLAGVAPA